jgi:hypothetical protein
MSKCFHGEATFGQLFNKNVQQEEKKMKCRRRKIYIGFGLGFPLILQCGYHYIKNKIIATTLVPRQIGLPS